MGVFFPKPKCTVVANAFLYNIYVKCEGDSSFKSEVSTETYSVDLNKTVMAYTKQNAIEPSAETKSAYMKISAGHIQEFYPKSSEHVYLSIIYPDNDNSWKIICCMHKIPQNQNAIVMHSGSVKVTKNNSCQWTDKDGRNHKEYADKCSEYQKAVKKMKIDHRKELSEVRIKHAILKEDQ